jgi:hypothetical protein
MKTHAENTRHTTAEIETMRRYCSSTLKFIRNLYANDSPKALTPPIVAKDSHHTTPNTPRVPE